MTGPWARHAPQLAQRWEIFPLVPMSKIPYAGTHGHLDATQDPERIARWAAVHPDSNIGIRPGPLELVLDVDDPALFTAWRLRHGLELPPTRAVRTRRGRHYYLALRAPIDARANVRDGGFDIKTRRGFVLSPGSLARDGTPYELRVDLGLAQLPDPWLAHLTRPRRGTPAVRQPAAASGEVPGQRMVRILATKRPGDGRRGLLRYYLGEAYRCHGGDARLVAALVATAIDIGVEPGDAADLAAWMADQYAAGVS